MKKTLLTTTAVALTGFAGTASAVEVAAGAVNLNISGFYTANIGIASVDGAAGTDFDGIDVHTNTEIHFKPSITLDNGLKVGVTIELEGNTSGDQIDESFITFSGDFGKVIVGSENSVGYKMSYGAPDVSLMGVNSGSLTAFVPYSSSTAGADIFRGTLGSTFIENARNNDAERISYFSPSFGGFQAGISYARNNAETSGPVDNNLAATLNTDFVDIAASYSGSFGGLDLGLSARYGTASAVSGTDPEVWGAGISLGFGSVKFGGSFAEQDGTGTANQDGSSFDVGVSFANGPMSYSLTYFQGTNVDNDTGTTDEELESIIAAATYKVNGNFKVSAFIASVDFDEEASNADDIEATVVGFGAKFSF